MRLLNDNVLFEVIEEEQSGKVLVADKDEQMVVGKGRVTGVGPGHSYGEPVFKPTTVKIGDTIVYIKQTAYKVEIKDKEYRCIRERDVLLVL